MRDIFSDVGPDFANLRPDGVFLRESDVKYVMVDFTRGYGSSREDLQKHEEEKCGKYASLVETLKRTHTVEFFPLACTYNGAIAEDSWRKLMECLEIDSSKAQDKVLKTATKAICMGFSTMVDIRLGCLTQNRLSHHSS